MMHIPSGAENVILYCICRRNTNVAVGPARWFINNNEVTRTQASGSNPYLRDNVPAPLIIPSFNVNHVGRYGCKSVYYSVRVTIDLVLSRMCNFYSSL